MPTFQGKSADGLTTYNFTAYAGDGSVGSPFVTQTVIAPSTGGASGQATPGGSAGALPSQACCEILLQNDPASPQSIRVGFADHQYICLQPGQSESIAVSNANLIYHKLDAAGAGGATLNWMARN